MASTTIGTSSVDVLTFSPARQNVYFRNESAAGQKIYIFNGPAQGLTTGNADNVLVPGEWIAFTLPLDGPDLQGCWSAVADGAGAVLYYRDMRTPPAAAKGA